MLNGERAAANPASTTPSAPSAQRSTATALSSTARAVTWPKDALTDSGMLAEEQPGQVHRVAAEVDQRAARGAAGS